MPCHTRMKTILTQGFLWLCLLSFGFVLCVIEPGYLDFDNLPDTNFSCVGKVIGGYYADLETSCQMFHVCTIGQLDEPMDIRFLCLNGTVFDQETRVCERVDEVDCSKSERFYHLNLELYGNTAPPIVEEPANTEPPTSTTSTTTPRSSSTSRTTRATFYTTAGPTIPPTTHSTPKVITSNQFPIHSGPDIRFNPEEINIRLTPGSAPIIKSPGVSFQQQSFNGEGRIQVTTHVYKQDVTSPKTTTTPKPKSVVSYGLQHTSNKNYQNHQNPHSYDYSYQNTENTDADYHTDLPSGEYSDLGYDQMNFESTNQKKTQVIPSTTKRPFISSTPKPSLQLPVPLFPTLPPLTFSSPAPFSLSRHHVENKRSNDHQRPRIIISASASVSDASGRRLNYSLGTIGQHILGKAPHSYDEYKEGDVGLDPFYHDVPKVNKPRRKRSLEEENSATEVTSTEEVEGTTHWIPPDYVDDNYEPLTYNISDNNTEVTTKTEDKKTPEEQKPTEKEYEYYYEYIDDNYEPSIYDTIDNKTKETDPIVTTTENTTPSEINTQETTIESNTITESLKDIQRDTTETPTTVSYDDTTQAESIQESTVYPEIETNAQETTTLNSDEFITTTEPVTVPTDTLQEQIITTSKPVTETITENSYQDNTTHNPEDTTPNAETTTSSREDTTPNHENTTSNQKDTTVDQENTTPNYETTTYNQETTTHNQETITDYKEITTNVPNSIYLETTTIIYTTEQPETTLNSQETTTESSSEVSTTSTTRYQYLRTREPAYKRFSRTKPTTRHRFSSPTIHMSQSVLKLRGNKFANPSKGSFSSSEEIRSEVISHRLNKILPESKLSTTISYDDVPVTDAPLSKSANPTEPKNTKNHLSTTPITKTTLFIPRRFTYDVMKSFNCFGKQLNKFYEDPRDCRLFHYCTPGYSETQVLDMKFVCDYGTYFDSDKLICTKIKPQRCK